MRSKETPAKRMETVFEILNTNGARLSRDIGFKNPSTLYHITNEVVQDISPRVAEAISTAYPQISYEYLIGISDAPLADKNQMGYMMQKKLFNEMAKMKSVLYRVLEILEENQ